MGERRSGAVQDAKTIDSSFETVEEGREIIDAIDVELVAILVKRAETAISINGLKRQRGQTRYDTSRESEILGNVLSMYHGPLTDDQITDIYRVLFRVTKEAQVGAELAES